MSSKYYTEEQIDNLIAGIEAGNKENERLTQRIVELEAQLPAESGGTVGLDSGDGSTQRLVEIGERDLAELTRKAKAFDAIRREFEKETGTMMLCHANIKQIILGATAKGEQ